MKIGYFILFSLSILVCSVSCKKNTGDAGKSITGKSIIGTWELRQASGGMMPGAEKYTPGNGHILHYDSSNYEMHVSGQIVKNGQYTIVTDTTIEDNVCLVFPKGEFTDRIIYDGVTTGNKQFFEISGNQLIFYAGCYAFDAGHREVYERIAD